MERKRILIFTGKFPASGSDTDGGSILIYSLINSLKNSCDLDVLFTRKFNPTFEKISGVNNVFFETYRYHLKNKFERRIKNQEQICSRLKEMLKNYDKIIITHVSKAFGIDTLSSEERKKIVLFPMFLSHAYERSNEFVPEEYKRLERKTITSVERIYTPSESEKRDIIDDFGVYPGKIKVIPRGYSSLIKPTTHSFEKSIHLLNIGSIKKQKNILDSIKIAHLLIQDGFDVALHIVGGIQDDEVYEECCNYIKMFNIESSIIFHGIVSQLELSKIIEGCHINISTSHWETYGRGIFEGMAGGLPTLLYDHIDCVNQYVEANKGILFVHTLIDFKNAIIKLYSDNEYYQMMSKQAIVNVLKLSEEYEKIRFNYELVNNKILLILGTRPEAIKLIPVIEELKINDVPYEIINTNQHSDLIDDVLKENGIIPDYKLDIFGKSNDLNEMKNEIIKQIDNKIIESDIRMILVQGDTLSALAGAEYGYNHKIDVAHVEAGMRTFDFTNPYPEEKYRVMIDQYSKFFFCPSKIEEENLLKENIKKNVFVTGNTFTDYRLKNKFKVTLKNQVLVTIHRRENIVFLDKIMDEIKQIAIKNPGIKFLFPLHPNPIIVKKAIKSLSSITNVELVKPLNSEIFFRELLSSLLVISDSGGIQEECILAGKKMIVVRSLTERRYDFDFMRLVNPNSDSMVSAFDELISKNIEEKENYFYGNGNARKSIVRIIKEVY
ncbi:MAG: non-hydrolyzing UDP-N-acetylglucosamine 2-epimerase [Bacilli bacterium]